MLYVLLAELLIGRSGRFSLNSGGNCIHTLPIPNKLSFSLAYNFITNCNVIFLLISGKFQLYLYFGKEKCSER